MRNLLLSLLMLTSAGLLHARQDASDWYWHKQHKLPVFWDNVENGIKWVDGEKPVRNLGQKQHRVYLSPGQWTLIAVPGRQWLRVLGLEKGVSLGALQVMRSVDSRSFVEEPLYFSDDKSQGLSSERIPHLSWMRLQNRHDTESLVLGLFVSRQYEPGTHLAYHYPLKPENDIGSLQLGYRGEQKSFWPLHDYQALNYRVQGPARLRIRSRLLLQEHLRSAYEPYPIAVSLNGRLFARLELESADERYKLVRVDQCTTPLARMQEAYLDIPQGQHHLALNSLASQYVAVSASRAERDYLFDSNAPDFWFGRDAQSQSLWDYETGLSTILMDARTPLPEQEPVVQGMMRDTRFLPSALEGLERMAGDNNFQYDDFKRFQTVQRDIVSPRQWIHLLPSTAGRLYQQRVMTLVPLSLAEQQREQVLWSRQLRSLQRQQLQAKLVNLKAGEVIEYRLPRHKEQRRLRMYFTGGQVENGDGVSIQLGDRPVRKVLFSQLQTRNEAYLKAHAADLSAAILDGELMPAGVSAQWFEIKVPAGISSLRVAAQRQGVWLAARLEQSVLYSPSERDYLTSVSSLGSEQAQVQFFRLLRAVQQGRDIVDDVTSIATKELLNQWLPLARYLKLQRRYFAATRERHSDELASKPDHAKAHGFAHQARLAEKNGDFVLAVEAWTQAIHHSAGRQRDALRLQRGFSLVRNNNIFLANREWWNLYLDSRIPAIRRQALEAILDQSRQADDAERVIRVLSAALIERPSPQLMTHLVQAMVKAGEMRKALNLGLLLGNEQQVAEALLKAAVAEGWWQVFDRVYSGLPEGVDRHYWAGIREAELGEYSRAQQHWRHGGSRGTLALGRVAMMADIRAGLSHTQVDKRRQALLQWKQLQSDQSMAGWWQPASEFIASYAGAERLILPELGVQQDLYVATPERPLQIQAHGAQRLRLLIRPQHPADSNGSLDDWLVLRTGEQQLRIPISNNPVDHQRHLLGKPDTRIGLRVTQEIKLGPGFNKVELSLLRGKALIDVQRWQGIEVADNLPPLRRTNVHAWFDAGNREREAASIEVTQAVVDIASECDKTRQSSQIKTLSADFVAAALEQQQSVTQMDTAYDLVDPLLKQLLDLLWQIEKTPENTIALAQHARQLIAEYPDRSDLQKYIAYVQNRTAWQAVMTLERRAGMKRIELPHPAVENPVARINHALLAPLARHQRRLRGHDDLLMVLEREQALRLKFVFDLEATRISDSAALKLKISMNGKSRETLHFTEKEQRASVDISVPGGAHSLRFTLVNPYAGQGVKMSVYEKRNDNPWIPYEVEPLKRSYHVATQDEPLVMHAQGINRVRVDEWRVGGTHSQYRDLAPGWQSLTLTPPAGQQEALYRVFEQSIREAEVSMPTLLPGTGLPALSPMLPSLVQRGVVKQMPTDSIPLWGQEDGTWSLLMMPTSRRNIDEDDGGFDDAEAFFDIRLSHRKYLEHFDLYHHGELLFRARADGGPVFGARENINVDDIWRKVDLDVNGSIYVQDVNGDIGNEWAAYLRARLSRNYSIGRRLSHKPSVSGFVRSLSLDRLPAVNSMDVDQDIFTRYKRQHLYGLQVCDDLTYRPWVDVRYVASACVGSNEDMNLFEPDHVRFRVGARSLVGDLLLRADFSVTEYLADEDRSDKVTRERLRLEADWLRWQTSRNGFQLGLRLEHDFSLGENSAWLTLGWHRAKGRFFRDFRPQELSFRGLRQRLHTERLYPGE